MIDPDYNPPQLPRRVPYAGPLPLRHTGAPLHPCFTEPAGQGEAFPPKPRLPGKPVQNMPPSPHRQGWRGYAPPETRPSLNDDQRALAFTCSALTFAVVASVLIYASFAVSYSYWNTAKVRGDLETGLGCAINLATLICAALTVPIAAALAMGLRRGHAAELLPRLLGWGLGVALTSGTLAMLLHIPPRDIGEFWMFCCMVLAAMSATGLIVGWFGLRNRWGVA